MSHGTEDGGSMKRLLLWLLSGILVAVFLQPTRASAAAPEPECPSGLNCVFVPAAYQNNDPDNPGDWGNYDKAQRPKDSKVTSVVVHDTEGDLQSVLDAFRDPKFGASSHYVVAPNGTIYQMVRTRDIAWHAGNWWVNQHSIGIEHVGYATTGRTSYTPEMYAASAKLVQWLSKKYHFPLDRQHVLGHDNVPPTRPSQIGGMHVDPGPFWDWQRYLRLMGARLPSSVSTQRWAPRLVTVLPDMKQNTQEVTGCWPDATKCIQSGPQTANFVYLRTQPNETAPFIADPKTGQGSTELKNEAARAYYGQQFAIAQRKVSAAGVWYRVWFGGTTGWFFSPTNAATARPTRGLYATLKSGKTEASLFGRPVPGLSEYPATLNPPPGTVPAPTVLSPYVLKPGQRYSVALPSPETAHFYNATFDQRLPYDGTNFKGGTRYVGIQFNGRFVFVKKADVDLVSVR